MKKLPFRPLDYILLAITIAAVGISTAVVARHKEGKNYLVISTEKEAYVYQLNQDQEVRIPGLLGESVIRIEKGGARFIESPCTNKICIHSGELRAQGDFAACLPNNVIAHIEAK